MRKTLQRILETVIVLCALNKPCYAVPFHPEYMQEPNAVAKRVESGYNIKALTLTTTIAAVIGLGLAGLDDYIMFHGKRKIN